MGLCQLHGKLLGISSGHARFKFSDTGTLFKIFTGIDVQGLDKLSYV